MVTLKKLEFIVAVAFCYAGDAGRCDRVLGHHGRARRNVRRTSPPITTTHKLLRPERAQASYKMFH